jgi:hypothetical protein
MNQENVNTSAEQLKSSFELLIEMLSELDNETTSTEGV